MNFYEKQERARKQTTRLVSLFVVALLSLIFLIAFAMAAIGYVFGFYTSITESYETGQSVFIIATKVFNWQYLAIIAGITLLLVTMAFLFRLLQLSRGGRVIAEQLDGRLVNINPRTSQEKRLLNVVEEMAIASGMAVPPVYVIDESSINAFAAGYKPKDAIIGVTQGAIDQLTRTELQGVIAHEFSHILNGDMRLNLRLVGVVYGITFIADIGRHFLGGFRYTSTRRSGKYAGASLGVGVILVMLGYLGVFFANLIKAAISRQREYLADASAVQFTRNNQGIANALKKIGGLSAHSCISKHDGSDVSHMLFAQGMTFKIFSGLLATHPPLEKRIKQVDSLWDGKFIYSSLTNQEPSETSVSLQSGLTTNFSAEQTLSSIEHSGEVSVEAVECAEAVLGLMRTEFNILSEEIHDPYSASAFIFCLLLEKQTKKGYKLQLYDLKQHQPSGTAQQVHRLSDMTKDIDSIQLMMLIDIALPILKQLSLNQFKNFKAQMQRLIKMDNKFSLKEWALYYWIDSYYSSKDTMLRTTHSLDECKLFAAQLLSALVHVSCPDDNEGQIVFKHVTAEVLSLEFRWYSAKELSINSLTKALNQLVNLKALQKPMFLKACVSVAQHDDIIEPEEMLIIRCIAQILDCPFPAFECRGASIVTKQVRKPI